MRTLILAATTLFLAMAAQAATIVNGSFEGAPSDPFQTLFGGSTAIEGWTVGGHSVDWIGSYWQAAEGGHSIDLNGSGQGSISQLLTGLVVGREYTIRFAMSGNPVGRPWIKQMRVSVGAASAIHTFDTAGVARPAAMGWAEHSFVFVAAAREEWLTFSAVRNGFYGPAIDNVRISAVPLPASAALMLAGVGALAAFGRRGRASARRG